MEIELVFEPIHGMAVAQDLYKAGKNPYGEAPPKVDDFPTYWLYEGHRLQWGWWQIELKLQTI